jgi:glutathione S-transferase
MSSLLKVYGHWVSQPSRSVGWLLKLNNANFDWRKVEPMRGDQKKPEFLSKFPLGHSPAIDDSGFYLAEGSPIMKYMCEKHSWNNWYPQNDIQKRARIDEYLSHHHTGPRMLTLHCFRPVMLALMSKETPITKEDEQKGIETSIKIALRFEKTFLHHSDSCFIGGGETPSIADLFAYCEFAQVTQLGIMDNYDGCDRLENWLAKMKQLDHHDDVHQSLFKLSSLYVKYKQKRDA